MSTTMWDPYDVWQRLLRDHPVSVEDPAASAGKMDAETAGDFWMTVAEYPDPLQDALYVIAHALGFEAALTALDSAIAAHLEAHRATQDANPTAPADTAPRRANLEHPSERRRFAVAM